MPFRMVIIKKSGDNRCWGGCGKIETLLHCWWECKLVQPLWKTAWWFLKCLEIEISFDSAIPLLSIYPKDYTSFYCKDTSTCMLICGTVYNNKDLETTQMPNDDRLDKENVAHIHHWILYSHKKDEIMYFVGTWINLEIILSKTDTRTEKTLHVLTNRCVLNSENTWTQGGEHHTLGSIWGARARIAGGGEVGDR